MSIAEEFKVANGPSWERRGDWMQTYSGRKFWPLDPRPDEVDIIDIAHSLALQCRYTGHTTKFYSVAEHSVLVSRAVPEEFALWGLLHDASEAYLTDIPRPIKPYLPDYKLWEKHLMRCIAIRFKLDRLHEPEEVKAIDTRLLHNERAAIMTPTAEDWHIPGEPLPGVEVRGLDWQYAEVEFYHRFLELTGGAE